MPFIYRIANHTSDDVYYGSTIQKYLCKRLAQHRGHRSSRSRDIVACPTAYIELVEEVSVEDQKVRERWWIENHPCVNRNIPRQDTREWIDAYKPTKAAKQRERRALLRS